MSYNNNSKKARDKMATLFNNIQVSERMMSEVDGLSYTYYCFAVSAAESHIELADTYGVLLPCTKNYRSNMEYYSSMRNLTRDTESRQQKREAAAAAKAIEQEEA